MHVFVMQNAVKIKIKDELPAASWTFHERGWPHQKTSFGTEAILAVNGKIPLINKDIGHFDCHPEYSQLQSLRPVDVEAQTMEVRLVCWRRCRFEPHADRRLGHGKRAARGVRLEFRRALTGSPQTRRMAQIGIGANT